MSLTPLLLLALFPPNAPWDAVMPEAENGCTSCHFDVEPVRRSEAILVGGLPERAAPGSVHRITLALSDDAAQTAAFLARFDSGTIVDAEGNLEVEGPAVRAPEPVALPARWSFRWKAPSHAGEAVLMVAANAANDDASPFGDQTHYAMRRVVIARR